MSTVWRMGSIFGATFAVVFVAVIAPFVPGRRDDGQRTAALVAVVVASVAVLTFGARW